VVGWGYHQSVYSAVLKPLSFMALWTPLTSFRLAQTNNAQGAIWSKYYGEYVTYALIYGLTDRDQNATSLTPQFFITIVFDFSWHDSNTQEK